MDTDSEAPENWSMFVRESDTDIQKKLHKLEDTLGMPLLLLVSVVKDIKGNFNQVQQRQDHWKVKQQAILLAAALTQGNPRPGPLQG